MYVLTSATANNIFHEIRLNKDRIIQISFFCVHCQNFSAICTSTSTSIGIQLYVILTCITNRPRCGILLAFVYVQNLVRKWGGNGANQRPFLCATATAPFFLPSRHRDMHHFFIVRASGAVALKVAPPVPSTVKMTYLVLNIRKTRFELDILYNIFALLVLHDSFCVIFYCHSTLFSFPLYFV